MALAERLQAIDSTFGQRTAETDRMLGQHARAIVRGVRQADLATQSGARQQLGDHAADRQPGRRAVERGGARCSPARPRRCAKCRAGCSTRSTASPSGSRIKVRPSSPPPRRSNSSNTKIDSILEGRHQAIIALLHTVNTKAQDLDNMMRSYAGVVEGAMTNAEARAKQVGSALARDTAGQAQAGAGSRSSVCATRRKPTRSARSATSKASFETVITQIGRQLEQIRGQFDNTSRGMREAAQKTATDLDSMRAGDAEAHGDIARAHGASHGGHPQSAQRAAERDRGDHADRPAGGACGRSLSGRPRRRRAQWGSIPRPLPQFDARGGDIGQVAGGLAQQLSGASYAAPRGQAPAGGQWSVGDLLSRASEPADQGYAGGPSFGARPAAGAAQRPAPSR